MAVEKQNAVIEDGEVFILQAGMPVYVKTADICAMTGKSNQWIGQLVSQGTLNKQRTKHGTMFNLAKTIRAYCDMLNARNGERTESEEKIKQRKEKAEADIKAAKAVVAKLEAAELEGKMHRAEDVAAMTEDLVYNIRGALLALPGRLAVDVVTAESPAEAADIIRKEVYRIMQELSRYRYDPNKYEERVRQRMNWEVAEDDPDE